MTNQTTKSIATLSAFENDNKHDLQSGDTDWLA